MLTRLWERVLPTVTDRPPLNLAIFNDTGATRHYGCELVMSTLTGGLTAHGMTSAWSHRVGVDWRTFRHEIPRFPAIAGIVVNGEGSIHHSASRPRARYLSQLGNFAHDDLGVPAFLLNATISDIEDDVADELRAFDRIWVRESGSLAELEARAITSKVVPDLTLSTPLKSAWRRSGICGTDSVLGEVSQAIATLCDRRGWPVRPMQRRPQGANDGRQTAAAYAKWLSSHALVVTGRFHAVTMCIATRTPFVAVESNSPKISSLVRDVFGDTRRVLDLDAIKQLNPDSYVTWSREEIRALKEYMRAARPKTFRMFADVAAVLSLRR
ncbi:MAG: hypothetical protein C0484_15370 [Rhodospirillum sp.]|jgi:hypothetical protein|nr:hypothetical protein [Rhodospirillum sp.]